MRELNSRPRRLLVGDRLAGLVAVLFFLSLHPGGGSSATTAGAVALNSGFTPRVRIAFSFQSKYLGMSPFRCPSLFSILAYLEYDSGVFHPIGGCGAVSENMAVVASRLGGNIRLGESVEEIDFDGKRATAVRTAKGSTQPMRS